MLFFLAGTLLSAEPAQPWIFGLPKGGSRFQWAQKLPLGQKFSHLPSYGLVTMAAWFLFIVPLWVLQRSPSHGLVVHLVKSEVSTVSSSDGPIVVRLKFNRSGKLPNLYLQSKPVSWNAFSGALKDALKIRRDWVVYFQGDADLEWADVIRAMDIIRGTPAKVILLMPGQKLVYQ